MEGDTAGRVIDPLYWKFLIFFQCRFNTIVLPWSLSGYGTSDDRRQRTIEVAGNCDRTNNMVWSR